MYNFLGVGSGQGSEEVIRWHTVHSGKFLREKTFTKLILRYLQKFSLHVIHWWHKQPIRESFLLESFLISRSQYAKCAETCLYWKVLQMFGSQRHWHHLEALVEYNYHSWGKLALQLRWPRGWTGLVGVDNGEAPTNIPTASLEHLWGTAYLPKLQYKEWGCWGRNAITFHAEPEHSLVHRTFSGYFTKNATILHESQKAIWNVTNVRNVPFWDMP